VFGISKLRTVIDSWTNFNPTLNIDVDSQSYLRTNRLPEWSLETLPGILLDKIGIKLRYKVLK